MDFAEPMTKRIDRYQDPHLSVDLKSQIVQLDGLLVELTQKEFELLSFLIEHAGELVPRSVLLAMVWRYTSGDVRTRTVDVHVRRLRRKLGQYSKTYIETIFGLGYRFQPYRAHAHALAEMASGAAVTAENSRPALPDWRWRVGQSSAN